MKRNFTSGKYTREEKRLNITFTIEEKFTLNVLRPSFKGIPVETPEEKPDQPSNMNLLEQTEQQEKLIQKTDAKSNWNQIRDQEKAIPEERLRRESVEARTESIWKQ